jgi:hypothetical protein
MIDPDNVRSLDWPRSLLALAAVGAVSILVGEALLLVGRLTRRSVAAAVSRIRRR